MSIKEILIQKFTSGNGIKVERAIITREEYEDLILLIESLEEYKWMYEDLQN